MSKGGVVVKEKDPVACCIFYGSPMPGSGAAALMKARIPSNRNLVIFPLFLSDEHGLGKMVYRIGSASKMMPSGL